MSASAGSIAEVNAETFDVAVIGGGVAGVACATAAARAGVRVILVCASGLSARATAIAVPRRRESDKVGCGEERFRLWQRAMAASTERQRAAAGRELDDSGVRLVVSRAQVQAGADGFLVETVEGSFSVGRVVVATGSGYAAPDLPGAEFLTPWGQLLDPQAAVPATALLCGHGAYTVELATLLAGCGVQVTIAFEMEELLPAFDADLARRVATALVAEGIRLRPEVHWLSVALDGDRVALTTDSGTYSADIAIIEPGHPGHVDLAGMGLDQLNLRHDHRGVLYVDRHYQTSMAGLFAIGDCADHAGHGGDADLDLCSVAMGEGQALAHYLAGETSVEVRYDLVPKAVRGPVDAAAVGLSEMEARAAGYSVAIAMSTGTQADRFVKLVAEDSDGTLLGCHALGDGARELVSGVELAMAGGLTASALAAILPAHPTLAEELVRLARELSAAVGAGKEA